MVTRLHHDSLIRELRPRGFGDHGRVSVWAPISPVYSGTVRARSSTVGVARGADGRVPVRQTHVVSVTALRIDEHGIGRIQITNDLSGKRVLRVLPRVVALTQSAVGPRQPVGVGVLAYAEDLVVARSLRMLGGPAVLRLERFARQAAKRLVAYRRTH